MLEARIEQIKQQRKRRLENKFNIVSWKYAFPRLSEYIPGFLPGTINSLIAGTNVGKTKMSKFLTVITPYLFYKKTGKPFHTIYLALEESKEEFIDNLATAIISLKYNINIDYASLNSFGNNILSDKKIKIIEDVMLNEVADILKHITIIDSVYNPTGLYHEVKKVAEKLGTINTKLKEFIDNKTQEVYNNNVFDSYVLNNPEMSVFVVADHLSLLNGEYDNINNKYIDGRGAMSRWSTYYCKNFITKKYKFTVLNVQQTAMASESLDHYKHGKLEPQISDLGDNKLIARDSSLILALFSPYIHRLKTHEGYNIEYLKNNYVSLQVLKNRYGRKNLKVGLEFNGAAGTYKELPTPNNNKINAVYDKYK